MKFIRNKINLGILFAIFLSAILRLTFLGSVPYGFANDEVSYILSGYTIAQTSGYDIAGNFLPLSVNLDSSLSPVPVYIIALFIKFLGLSFFVARLPFALMGIGIVVLVYYIVFELFNNRKISFLSSIIVSLSSWHLLVTRGAWDVVPAQFFFLLGLLIFLKKINKGSILWAIPAYLLGFFSYHGTKVFFVIFVTFTIFLYWKKLVKKKNEFALFVAGIIGILILFGIVTITQSVTRQSEIIFTNKGFIEEAEKQIDYDRYRSSAPYEIREIESNKTTYFFDVILSKYLNAFSTNFLFSIGDIQPIFGYGVFFKGVLYPIDLIFIIFSIVYFPKWSKSISRDAEEKITYEDINTGFVLIVGGLLISPLPSVVGAGNSYVIRSFMMVPFISALIGIGAYIFWQMFDSKKVIQILTRIFLIAIYFLFVSRFLYQYVYQFSTFGAEYWNQSSRELSEYVELNKDKFDRIIIVTSEDKVFFQYAFISHADPKEIKVAWEKNWPVRIGKVIFENSCYADNDAKLDLHPKTLYITNASCHEQIASQRNIVDPLEPLRVIWKLYEN